MTDLLMEGLNTLQQNLHLWTEEDNYYRGKHERPFAPEGVNKEYQALQEMAVAPWLRLVGKAPVQRLRVDGFRTDSTADVDMDVWKRHWKANRLDARQRVVYIDAVKHGRGVVSVMRNVQQRDQSKILIESPRDVFVAYDDVDVFTPVWAIKTWTTVEGKTDTSSGMTVNHAVVYTRSEWARYRQANAGAWEHRTGGRNPLGRVPFVEFRPEQDSLGRPMSMLRPLFPMQRAIDTMRFDLLLAAQFSAYRQRAVTGFDPVLRDENGEILWAKNTDGSLKINPANGQPIPLLVDLGRPGVDRMQIFPGGDTKIWDLAESNLNNYVSTIKMLVQQMAAIAQVPPQYLLGDMANLSGDALDSAESTLGSLADDMKREFGSSWEDVISLADRSVGGDGLSLASEVIWGDAVAKSFGVVVDGVQKLISTGFPREAAWEMIPGSTQVKVQSWVKMADAEIAEGNPYANALGITAKAESNAGAE